MSYPGLIFLEHRPGIEPGLDRFAGGRVPISPAVQGRRSKAVVLGTLS